MDVRLLASAIFSPAIEQVTILVNFFSIKLIKPNYFRQELQPIWGCFLIKESHAPVLRARKAAQLRNESGKIQTQKGAPAPKNIGILILRPLKLLMFSPVVLLLSFSMSITYSYIYLLFTTLPAVFMDIYGVSQSTAGYLFTGLGIGMFVGLIICLLTFPKIMARKKKRAKGKYSSESLMSLMIPGTFIIPISLFWYGWSIHFHAHYIIPIIATGFLGFGFISTFVSLPYLLRCLILMRV